MTARLDFTGKKLGKLTVIEDTGKRSEHGKIIWRCKCDCGNEVLRRGSTLSEGDKLSCGCVTAYADFRNRRFGKLLVIREGDKIRASRAWVCKCDCGKEITVKSGSLKIGHTKSCGCIKRDAAKYCYMRFYNTWTGMLSRCYSKKNIGYKNYGGRGISVCKAWREDYMAFHNWALKRWKEGHTLDRRNNDGNYTPYNCRYATPKQQQNNRRVNRRIRIRKSTKTLAQWVEHYGLTTNLVYSRVYRGWDIVTALTTKRIYNVNR
jgi:hypothetical protein